MFSPLDIIVRLLLITVLAGVIGLEREHLKKPAGIRTNILVGLGSTLVMILSMQLQFTSPSLGIDPGRIAGQVITGIGFLGAGAIIRDRGGVHGLTTAATIWVVSAIGLAVGMGFYQAALITAFFTLITLFILGRLEHHPDPTKNSDQNTQNNDNPL